MLDGERDPRNLVIGFQTFVKVVHSIPEFVRFSEVLPTAAVTAYHSRVA